VAKSSRNAAATNLQRLLNSSTFKAAVPTAQEVALSVSKSDEATKHTAFTSHDEKRIEYISLDLLLDNPYQPRREIPIDDDLCEMAEGIKAYDLLGAYPARKHPEKEGYFQLGFGHRRREASRLAGKATMPIVIEDLDNSTMAGLAAVENIHRKDLTDLELGRLFLSMQNEGYTQEEIADSIKKKRGYVVNRLRLAEAPDDIQAFVEKKPDSLRAVAYVIKVEDERDRALLMDRLAAGTLTADDLAGDISDVLHMLKERDVSHEKHVQSSNGAMEDVTVSFLAEVTEEISRNDDEKVPSSQEQRSGALPNASEQQDAEGQEIEAIRIGSTKLRSILRSYNAYLTSVSQRKGISRREQQLIREIGETHALVMARISEASNS
jgi:ParB/RepB/Spo0J family partition protein